jgi:exonuclease III
VFITASGSSGYQFQGASEQQDGFYRQISYAFCASKLKVENHLGRKQGKLNVLNIFNKNCVINLKDFVSISQNESHSFKLNSKLVLKLAYIDIKIRNVLSKNRRVKNKNSGKNNFVRQSVKKQNGFLISAKIMWNIIVSMMLIIHGVHPNPGPLSNITFLTYNCRGLMENNKLKRVLGKLNKLVNKNYIIALQETHNMNPKILESHWKHNIVRNCSQSNKKGVALLFHNDYKINSTKLDKEERYIIADIEDGNVNLIIGNVYYPNTIREASTFCEEFYAQYLESQFINPSASCTIMGDLNTCFSKYDYLNRSERKGESQLAKQIKINNEACGLTDAYRYKNQEGGYTWNRGTCYSRLDYIFVSNDKISNIMGLNINWELDKSDHAALSCSIKVIKEIAGGRGIVKVNATLLEDEGNLSEMNNQLATLLNQIPEHWNPHTRLEYV